MGLDLYISVGLSPSLVEWSVIVLVQSLGLSFVFRSTLIARLRRIGVALSVCRCVRARAYCRRRNFSRAIFALCIPL